MRKLLVATMLMALMTLTGAAFACSGEHSASADELPAVTAAAPQSTPQAPATETTTKPKTTESNTGG